MSNMATWAPFHTRMVMALGTAWILDGLEITIAGAVGPVLTKDTTLGLTAGQVGMLATVYLLVRSSGHCSSAASPTRSAAATSSCSRWASTSSATR